MNIILDVYTFVVLLISVFVLGIFVGIVGAPFMQRQPEPKRFPPPRDLGPRSDGEELDPNERYWKHHGPAGGR
jgi:hypothetical protein